MDLTVNVKNIRQEALDVKSFELVSADATPLPSFTAGWISSRPRRPPRRTTSGRSGTTSGSTRSPSPSSRGRTCRRTFDEDKEILEAQQRIIGPVREPAFQVTIKADAGPAEGRLLVSMIEVESRGEA